MGVCDIIYGRDEKYIWLMMRGLALGYLSRCKLFDIQHLPIRIGTNIREYLLCGGRVGVKGSWFNTSRTYGVRWLSTKQCV